MLKAEQTETHERLRSALGTMIEMSQPAIESLLTTAQGFESEWLRVHLPKVATAMTVVPESSDPIDALARLRPAGRRMFGSP